jgi:hypothetical protein
MVESQGVKVLYAANLEAYLSDAVIHYTNSWFERGFVIKGSGTSSC